MPSPFLDLLTRPFPRPADVLSEGYAAGAGLDERERRAINAAADILGVDVWRLVCLSHNLPGRTRITVGSLVAAHRRALARIA